MRETINYLLKNEIHSMMLLFKSIRHCKWCGSEKSLNHYFVVLLKDVEENVEICGDIKIHANTVIYWINSEYILCSSMDGDNSWRGSMKVNQLFSNYNELCWLSFGGGRFRWNVLDKFVQQRFVLHDFEDKTEDWEARVLVDEKSKFPIVMSMDAVSPDFSDVFYLVQDTLIYVLLDPKDKIQYHNCKRKLRDYDGNSIKKQKLNLKGERNNPIFIEDDFILDEKSNHTILGSKDNPFVIE